MCFYPGPADSANVLLCVSYFVNEGHTDILTLQTFLLTITISVAFWHDRHHSGGLMRAEGRQPDKMDWARGKAAFASPMCH